MQVLRVFPAAKAVEEVLGKKILSAGTSGTCRRKYSIQRLREKRQSGTYELPFTTAMAHITQYGGKIAELLYDEAYVINSSHPFKGNMNIEKLEDVIKVHGAKNIPFIRMEASTNLIGGDNPFRYRT